MLSIYDAADREGGTCRAIFSRASANLSANEKVFETGSGYGLFVRPQALWVDAVADWSNQ